MDTIKIKGSWTKFLLAILGSLGFTMAGISLIITPETFVSSIIKGTFFIQIVGIAAVLFFGFALILLIKAFFTGGKFNLIITENGIIDNSTYSSVGMIKWEDIILIKSTKVKTTKFLLIYVKNSEKYINSKQRIKKMMLKGNFNLFGTPITITSNSLNCNFSKLEEVITKSYSMYLNKL
jgi:hypothetical protein